MNIYEAATSGKPFTHCDMIGAWVVVDGEKFVHRDNEADFRDMDFIRSLADHDNIVRFMVWSDLLRDDWELVDV